MSGITLSSAVRQNLLALQSTADMMSTTQNRLATGLKVNSALDNPNSFFTAQGLNNRASDLSSLTESMGQAVQTLKAADEGIKAITKLAEAAKAKANQAQQTTDAGDRAKFANEFNDLLGQIQDIAKDSGYNGKNLLGGTGNDLAVNFNETNSSSITIASVDFTDADTGLGIGSVGAGTAGTGTIALGAGADGDTLLTAVTGFADGDVLTATDAEGVETTLTVGAATDVDDLVAFLGDVEGVTAAINGTDIELSATSDVSIASDGALADVTLDATEGGWATESGINASIDDVNSALQTLRSQASTFGTNLTVVENRQNFTKSMIETLESGAGLLTLADTNEEGANLLALQTRQQLSSTALSFASQADQNVLRLF